MKIFKKTKETASYILKAVAITLSVEIALDLAEKSEKKLKTTFNKKRRKEIKDAVSQKVQTVQNKVQTAKKSASKLKKSILSTISSSSEKTRLKDKISIIFEEAIKNKEPIKGNIKGNKPKNKNKTGKKRGVSTPPYGPQDKKHRNKHLRHRKHK